MPSSSKITPLPAVPASRVIPPADSKLIESTAVPSDTISKSPSAFEPIVKPVSLKRSLFAPFKVKPVPSVCVKVVSESAPKLNTAESLNNLRSSPSTASFATDNPPSVCKEPSVVEVASVVLSVFIIPLAVNAPTISIKVAVSSI